MLVPQVEFGSLPGSIAERAPLAALLHIARGSGDEHTAAVRAPAALFMPAELQQSTACEAHRADPVFNLNWQTNVLVAAAAAVAALYATQHQ
jgi:hypothetical protein